MRKLTCAYLLLLGVSLSACETMSPATYSNFADNTFTLRNYEGAKLKVASITSQSAFDPGCRLVGPIEVSGNRPIFQFVQDSFNDEFKFAGVYSDDPDAVQLSATLTEARFSSMTGLTSGWWDFALTLSNPENGRQVSANSRYDFTSGFSAIVACQNTSQALTPAVQRLINDAVSDSEFPTLIGR